MVVQELHRIQHKHGYIPEADLYELSKKLNIPVYELFGVATFYPGFRTTPPPVADVLVCGDFPCRLRGAEDLKMTINKLVHDRGVKGVHVGHVSCLGHCDGAPAIAINDHTYARQPIESLLDLVQKAISGKKVEEQHFHGLHGPFLSDPYPSKADHYGAVKELCKTNDVAGALKKLGDAGLRGMGGAGFPTGTKWNAVKNAPGDEKFIVCNADECEVGTFKDREIMKNCPHLLAEGMILAGLVTGAKRGFIYIRHEYHDQIHVMEDEIKRARALGLVGTNVAGSGKTYELEVFVSPGGYIQGEESALLEAIEGKRGQPRVKPPFPVFVGLWGKPTVINNVETLAYTPYILMKGPDEWKKLGRQENNALKWVEGSNKTKWEIIKSGPVSGLKWMGVSGHVKKPGVYEVPMGMTYREAIYELGGGILGDKKLKAFSPSGPSGGFLPPSMIDLSMDFNIMSNADSMLGSGAIVAISEPTCLLDMSLNATRFFRNESCGKCVPCRVGSQKLVDILVAMTQGKGKREDLEQIEHLCDAMLMTSICGLGQVVPAPIQSTLKYWKDEVLAHASNLCPSGVCFAERNGA